MKEKLITQDIFRSFLEDFRGITITGKKGWKQPKKVWQKTYQIQTLQNVLPLFYYASPFSISLALSTTNNLRKTALLYLSTKFRNPASPVISNVREMKNEYLQPKEYTLGKSLQRNRRYHERNLDLNIK